MPAKGHKHTQEAKDKIRIARKGVPRPELLGDKNPAKKPGIGLKISMAKRGKSNPFKGERHPWWKGGITPKNNKIRSSIEYKIWRRLVFERDKFTCKFCGQVGGELQADHIKPFAYFPELRFELDNGRTLCKLCHQSTDTYLVHTKNENNK